VIEEIPAALDGERLDRVVAMLTDLSRSEASALVAAGEVRVNGQAVTSRTHRLAEGDELSLEVPEVEVASLVADASVAFDTLYSDTDVVVIDKPAGLVVHPGAGTPDGTLVQGLLARYPEIATVGEAGRPGIVHRLDRGTSGLLVVARSSAAYDGLVAGLARHEVERGYVALAWGTFDAKAGMVDAPIGRSPRSPTKMAVSARGKPARTRYEVRAEYHDPVVVSLVGCELETGRTHQIRVHLAAIDHPVVGDDRYGGTRQSLPMERPFLHAEHLRFAHPVTGEALAFSSPLAPDLVEVLGSLGGLS
jgi:23S rRNA pseudouridine1911/1915/1917 synthase